MWLDTKLLTAYNPVGCTLYLYKKNLAQMFRIKLTCSAEVFTVFCCNNYWLRELLGEEQSQGMKSKHNKGLCYEEAMREAFSEIFQNLREIENNNEKKFKLRQKMDFERRRGSAPALSLLKEEKTFFRQPALRRGSAPVLLKSSPTKTWHHHLLKYIWLTMQWMLSCFDEVETSDDYGCSFDA